MIDKKGAERLQAEEARLLACVHCGFCLTACPTYTRLGNEADSPRGRLVLMRAVAEGRIEPDSDAFRTHIDQCLGCRACEPVCPSGVQYGFLAERARSAAVDAAGQRWPTRLLLAVFGNRSLSALAGAAGRIMRAGGVARAIARMLPPWLGGAKLGLAMLAASRPAPNRGARMPHTSRRPTAAAAAPLSPATDQTHDQAAQRDRAFAEPHALQGNYPDGSSLPDQITTTRRRPRVALLQGCVQHSLFSHVNRDTVAVLRDAGCDIVDVPRQGCCGALHAHSGELDHALELARTNIRAFEEAAPDVIVVNAAGCGAMLKEYGEQLHADGEWSGRANALAARVRDISEYLMEIDYIPRGRVALRVTYDAPCHLHHAQRIMHAPLDLLRRIPGLELVPLANAEECCGGAGIYGITHPELGGRILHDKIEAIRDTRADVVLTPNPGCMMQIGGGLALSDMQTVVMHPVELLARSITEK